MLLLSCACKGVARFSTAGDDSLEQGPGVLHAQGFVSRVCAMLAGGGIEAARLAIEMLIKLCLFSARSYGMALQARARACA